MNARTAQYVLVQATPNLARQERVNVGVIVLPDAHHRFCWDFLKTPGKLVERVLDVTGVSWAITAQAAAVEASLKSIKDSSNGDDEVRSEVTRLRGLLANNLVMQPPKYRQFVNECEVLDELFALLVERPKHAKREQRKPRIDRLLQNAVKPFEQLLDPAKVPLNFLGTERTEAFSYSYLNGSRHCILPQRFDDVSGVEFPQKLAHAVSLADALTGVDHEQRYSLDVFAAFEDSEAERQVRVALAGRANVWTAKRDDEKLASAVREAAAHHGRV